MFQDDNGNPPTILNSPIKKKDKISHCFEEKENVFCLGYKTFVSKRIFFPEKHSYDAFCPIGESIKCRVTRKKYFFKEVFNLYVETEERFGVFALSAVKRKNIFSANNFIISEEHENSPFFTNKKCATITKKENIYFFNRKEEYFGSFFCKKKKKIFQKISVIIPSIKENIKNILFESKDPVWCNERNSFILDFGGRRIISSTKNVQIISKKDPISILIQIGKKDENMFVLDFKYPFSLLQAFSIMLCVL